MTAVELRGAGVGCSCGTADSNGTANPYDKGDEKFESIMTAINYKASFLVPDFIEIQRRSFSRFLEEGIIEEFSKINPIRSEASRLQLTFYPESYLLISPEYSVTEAVLQGKTYSCKLYVPAKLSYEQETARTSRNKNSGRDKVSGRQEVAGEPHVDNTASADSAEALDEQALTPEASPHPTGLAGHELSGSSPPPPSNPMGRPEPWGFAQPVPPSVAYHSRMQGQVRSLLYQGGPSTRRKAQEDVYSPTSQEGMQAQAEISRLSPAAEGGLAATRVAHPEAMPIGSLLNPQKAAQNHQLGHSMIGSQAVRQAPLGSGRMPSQWGNESASDGDEANLSWVLVGNLPLMTKRGHFIINGSPRVVINQLVRSPGVYFHERTWGLGKRKRRVVYADFVSRRGAWLRLEADKEGDVWARLKKTPKVPFPLFYEGMSICERDPNGWTMADREALLELHEEVNPTKKDLSAENGQQFLVQRFKNPKTYDLGRIGRERLNRRFGLSISGHQLTSKDLYAAFEQVQELQNDRILIDDIDHLKNRRVRASGELVQGQFETGLYRLEKAISSKMRKPPKEVAPRTLLNTKPLNAALREFFGSSPLSQYMDQTNPLAEITQKRRISSLGPGGISRETAGMAVRSIHPTHYGRICPIETPEGKNAGLVNSLTVYARVGDNGILETPYHHVLQGQAQTRSGVHYFSARGEEEREFRVAPGDVQLSPCKLLPTAAFPVREAGNREEDFREAKRPVVNYMAISPIQMISVATSLIPFLEHDDANRALMGSNMQRQAVPLLRPERPLVGTGLEAVVVAESGHALQSELSGYVSSVSGERVSVHSSIPIKSTKRSSAGDFRAIRVGLGEGSWSSCRPSITGAALRPGRGGMALEVQRPPLRWPGAANEPVRSNGSQGAGTAPTHAGQGPRGDRGPVPSALGWTGNSIASLSALQARRLQGACSYKMRPTLVDQPLLHRLRKLSCVKGGLSTENRPGGPWNGRHGDQTWAAGGVSSPVSQGWSDDLRSSIPHLSTRSARSGTWARDGAAVPVRPLQQRTQRDSNPEAGSQSTIVALDYQLQSYQRSNQETCLTQTSAVSEGDWVQRGDLLADCSASELGELALGKNILIAYLPWEGYNFEDAVVISERLVSDDVYTSIHVQKYDVETRETRFGVETITPQIPGVSDRETAHLDGRGIAKIGSWVREGDILVGKVSPKSSQPLSPYERLAYDIANVEAATTEDTSLRVPKGVEGRVVNCQSVEVGGAPLNEQAESPGRVRIYLAEKRRIQVGDKVAGRHGNKGIVSTVLPRQDMPYLPNGAIVDMVLNPLGIPSRMNVGQVFECLLGLAGVQLGQQFKITPFDEIYGAEASRSLVYLKLYQARLRTNQDWLFNLRFPGKTALLDGRTGGLFDQWVTVGYAYMLKLVHLVDEKIHARSTGPYSLVTKQPLGGRSKHGGQRLGEMEVWALEGFGAAYTLQEMLTSKSDDIVGREQVVEAILFKGKMSLGNPEAFKVLVRELQSLCLDVGVYTISPGRLQRTAIDIGRIP